jgi:hypothetical protein
MLNKTYQLKHSVNDDQILRQKLQISNLLILELVLHVICNSTFTDAELVDRLLSSMHRTVVFVSAIAFHQHSLFSK